MKYFLLILQKSYWKLNRSYTASYVNYMLSSSNVQFKDKKTSPFHNWNTEQNSQIKIIYDSNYGINQLVSS